LRAALAARYDCIFDAFLASLGLGGGPTSGADAGGAYGLANTVTLFSFANTYDAFAAVAAGTAFAASGMAASRMLGNSSLSKSKSHLYRKIFFYEKNIYVK